MNVARVDIPANRDIGTRFEIRGFPTIKLIRQGKVYSFSGRRTVEAITEFATSGYLNVDSDDVPPEVGMFGEIKMVFRHAFKQAQADVKKGNYFTAVVFLISMPFIFVGLVLLIIFVPGPEPPKVVKKPIQQPKQEEENSQEQQEDEVSAEETSETTDKKND